MRNWVYYTNGLPSVTRVLMCRCVVITGRWRDHSIAWNLCCRFCYGTGILPFSITHYRLFNGKYRHDAKDERST